MESEVDHNDPADYRDRPDDDCILSRDGMAERVAAAPLTGDVSCKPLVKRSEKNAGDEQQGSEQ